MAKKDFTIVQGHFLREYHGPGGNVVIPAGVKVINEYAFQSCKFLTSVKFPKGLKYIGKNAFFRCKGLTSLTLPDGLEEIGCHAFAGCSQLADIAFPNPMPKICEGVFQETAWLQKQKDCVVVNGCLLAYRGQGGHVDVPHGVTTIYAGVFSQCKSLTSVTLPAGIKIIPPHMFHNCPNLTEVTIPESVEIIGDNAFCWCENLKTITILGTGTKCTKRTFENCSAEIIADRLPLGKLPQAVRERLLNAFVRQYESGADIPKERMENYTKYIRRMRLKLFPQAIEDNRPMFYFILQEKLLTDSDFPELLELALQKNDAEITAAMLEYQKKKLKPVDRDKEFDKQVAIMETNILPVASAKKSWYYQKLSDGTLCITGYKGKELNVIVPNGIGRLTVTEIGSRAFSPEASPLLVAAREVRRKLHSVTIPEGIRKLGDRCFASCEKLTQLSLPNSLEKTGENILENVSTLESVDVPAGHKTFRMEGPVLVERRGKRCKILCCLPESSGVYVMPSGARELPGWLMNGKTDAIKEFVVSEGPKFLPKELLKDALQLTRVVLPASFAYFCCFDNCNALAEVVVNENNGNYRSIDGVLFNRDGTELLYYPPSKAGSVYTIPNNLEKIGEKAFYKCRELSKTAIPEGVRELGKEVFFGCWNLSEITIPGTVASIPWSAFEYSGLVNICIKDGVQEIELSAFRSCPKLTNVFLPASVEKIDSAAFDDSNAKLTIHAPAGSYAETFAQEHSIQFEALLPTN